MDQRQIRKIHNKIAPIIFLPLFLTVLTGVSYQIATGWFKTPGDEVQFLMYIHQGAFLGDSLKVFYVLLNALGVLAMLTTGILMTSIFRTKRTRE
jgi:hypothetical protein